jgi:DNA-binding GntR family transcriptional regulator
MKPVATESTVDAVVEELRNAILTGEMPPGAPISFRALQDGLGISHIPIREALRRLEVEGLVIVPHRRTPVVTGVAMEELSALYELRRMVEVATARLAVERALPADRERVREAFARFEAAAGDPDSRDYWERHNELHWALIARGANVWTQRVLDPLWRAGQRYVRLFVTRYGSAADALSMHRELVTAYETGDADRFGAALVEHFARTERVVREGYRAATAPTA